MTLPHPVFASSLFHFCIAPYCTAEASSCMQRLGFWIEGGREGWGGLLRLLKISLPLKKKKVLQPLPILERIFEYANLASLLPAPGWTYLEMRRIVYCSQWVLFEKHSEG